MFENFKKNSIENKRANILFHSTNLPYKHILNYVYTFGLLRNRIFVTKSEVWKSLSGVASIQVATT